MLKAQDIVVLVELALAGGDRSVRSIAGEIEMDPAGVHRSLKRLSEARLWLPSTGAPVLPGVRELLVHGVKYFFPAAIGGPAPGVPTAWSAAPLAGLLAPSAEQVVWPEPLGATRGLSVAPLHAVVPRVARERPDLGEIFALIDGIRLGDARIRELSVAELDVRLERLETVQ